VEINLLGGGDAIAAAKIEEIATRLGSKLIKSDLFAGKPEIFQLVRGKFEPESFALVMLNGAKLR
jgi:hypothetical protein